MTSELTGNAVKVLEARYLRRDRLGNLIETPQQLFRRVAHHVAAAEISWGGENAAGQWEEKFYQALTSLDFLPNSPTLMNAGTELGQLSACFVLPVGDSMVEIFDALKLAALIQQSGGGTGFSFSRLRPQGDPVTSTGGAASGPVSFMRIFDSATENIRQGGRRRGANMGVLRVDHPDIAEFVEAKRDGHSFRNFNLSVAATDEFMEAIEARRPFALLNPRTGEEAARVHAAELFQRIAQAAWETGDPGMIFLDAINRANPTPAVGTIEATNPCGEVPLLPYEACNLGSINLSHMVRAPNGSATGVTIDWDKLRETIHTAVRMLDDVIEVGRWPAPQIRQIVHANRKTGLGVMGFAEMLILLGIPYASERAASVADELMRFLSEQGRAASERLAAERGVFPNWAESRHAAQDRRLRNATLTSIAPTGTIGIIAGTSPGIEPLFALAYRREHVLNEQRLVELNPLFLRYAKRHGFLSDELLAEVQQRGTLRDSRLVPAEARQLFRTALEIAPLDHLRIQAAFQNHVDNAVSKTINLPHTATVEEVAEVYRQAWKLGLKGVTVYRYGSKGQQVLLLGAGEAPYEHEHFVRCDPHACKL
jgi:ribonucleoside-diphosphate reductase alpha chain